MNRIYLWPALALLTLALNSACRTQRGTDAALNDEQTDLLAAAMPPGLMSLVVPTADIPKYVEPATGDNGIPASLNGIWWTDAKSIQFVISFKNAVWNPKTRTASLVYIGPGTYVRRPGTEGTAPSKTGVSRDDFNTFQGYDIIFNESLDQATMLVAQSVLDERQTFHQDTGDFTLNFVKNGVWRRDTPGKDSYFLRRIVDEKGNKEPVFEDFLKAFGPQAQIFKSTLSMDKNTRNLKVPVKAGIETYVSLKGWKGENVEYHEFEPFTATFKAPFPLQVQTFGRSERGTKQPAAEPMQVILKKDERDKPEMIIALTAEQDGEVEIKLERAAELPVLKVGEATSVQLKANTLAYFRLENNLGPMTIEIKVQSDSPTDILFNRNRSAGRSGEKQNSLWGSTSYIANANTETITLKAREDSKVTVQVVKKDLKVRNLGSLKLDGSWQEATLEAMDTVDFWLVDIPEHANERYEVEIEEIGSKRAVPDLHMTNAGSAPIGLETYVRFGILNRDMRPQTIDQKEAFARKVKTWGRSSLLVYYGWPQQLERRPKYRLRATLY